MSESHGKLLIPDWLALDRVTDLQTYAGNLGLAVALVADLLDVQEAYDDSRMLSTAWSDLRSCLADLGLLGDVSDLITFSNRKESSS